MLVPLKPAIIKNSKNYPLHWGGGGGAQKQHPRFERRFEQGRTLRSGERVYLPRSLRAKRGSEAPGLRKKEILNKKKDSEILGKKGKIGRKCTQKQFVWRKMIFVSSS
jgi:hypothetical protein